MTIQEAKNVRKVRIKTTFTATFTNASVGHGAWQEARTFTAGEEHYVNWRPECLIVDQFPVFPKYFDNLEIIETRN